MIYINGTPYDNESFTDKICVREAIGSWITSGSLNIRVNNGNSKSILLRIKPYSGSATVSPFTDGARLNVELYTASGRNYLQTVILSA